MKNIVLGLCALCVLPLAFAKTKEAEWAGLIKQAAAYVKLRGDLRAEPRRVTELLHDRYVGQPKEAVLQDLDFRSVRREYSRQVRDLGVVLECILHRITPEHELSVTFAFRYDAKGRVTDVNWFCSERALVPPK
jgi:hypothetical protein